MSQSFELDIACKADAVSGARRWVSNLPVLLPEAILDDLRLLTTELVTNSIIHSETEETIHVSITVLPERIRVEVSDQGLSAVPHLESPDLMDMSGRGLVLVDNLADRWGVERTDCTSVWFELARSA